LTHVYRGAWVLPISGPPIRNGWVAVETGRIAACGGAADPPPHSNGPAVLAHGQQPPPVAILPGLVNAHTHLELSWMRGRVRKRSSMPEWASLLIALRRAAVGDSLPGIRAGIAESLASGTLLVGDVANTCDTYSALGESALHAMIFREMIGFNLVAAEEAIAAVQRDIDALPGLSTVRTSVVPHAPYSVSPALLAGLARQAQDRPVSIHLGESAAELELLESGTGPWRAILERVGVWNPDWRPPGCGPVEYLERLGLLSARLLAVHAVHLRDEEIARLVRAGATIVTCPRSNEWTGAGSPPVARFYESGVRVAIGTDSLASVDSLSVFDEMAAVRRLAPGLPAARILQSATLDGALALGFDEFGSIAPGKRPPLLSVRLPPDVDDVEEYLVGGIQPADLSWLA
jgi:cytosine/adenosine deaminase-related metal-dependent hydrolase